jgi:hypothetical protein
MTATATSDAVRIPYMKIPPALIILMISSMPFLRGPLRTRL